MNRRFRLIIFLLVLLIAASGVSSASADRIIFINDPDNGGVDVRANYETGEIIDFLANGKKVQLISTDENGEWGFIYYDDGYGYVPFFSLSSIVTYTMYVCTVERDSSLNVRSGPGLDKEIIGSLGNTSPVDVVEFYYTSDWALILYSLEDGSVDYAYVANRYLSEYKDGIYRGEILDDMLNDSVTPEPESTPEPTPTPKPKPEEISPTELIAELRTAKTVAEPFTILVHPSHPTGRVNLRWAPFKRAQAITSYTSGKELTVIGETENWYQVQDPKQKYSGFIAKYQVTASAFGTAE